MNDIYFFTIPDKNYSDSLSSFMAELSDSDDAKIMSGNASGSVVQYAYVRKTDSAVVGIVQYRPDSFFTCGSLGYLVRPSERCKGICKKMIADFLSFCSALGIPFLSAEISASNIPSLKAALACGGFDPGFAFTDNTVARDGQESVCLIFRCSDSSYCTSVGGIPLFIETNGKIFSPSAADKGTLAMLSAAELPHGGKILDLGCGSGIVGIYAFKKLNGGCSVWQTDVSEDAVLLSRKNASFNGAATDVRISDGFSGFDVYGLDVILSNPPYHTDFSVAKHFIEQGFRHLSVGGKMYMVTKRLDWYKNKLTSVFGGVKILEIDGYFVFMAEKRSQRPPEKEKNKGGMSAKLARKNQLGKNK